VNEYRSAGAPHPLVSVVIPAYNAAAYIRDAVDSVLTQTYPNIEIVVVNDGSTDDTAAVARSYGSRVRVFDQENRGIAGARNTGIRHALGSIIALLDADDVWLPERVERCVEVLQSDPNIGFVTTDAYLIVEDELTDLRYYGAYQRFPFPERALQLQEIARRNFVFVSVLFDRRLLGVTGSAFDETLRAAEDFDLWTQFLLAGANARLVPEPLALYRIREDSVSRVRDQQWRAHRFILKRYLRLMWLRGVNGRPSDEFEIGSDLVWSGQRMAGFRFMLHAILSSEARASQRIRFAFVALGLLANPRRSTTSGTGPADRGPTGRRRNASRAAGTPDGRRPA